jgi:2EXR family
MSRLETVSSPSIPLESPASSTPLHTFTLFPKLAAELRNMIWTHAALQPRYLPLDYSKGRFVQNHKKFGPRTPSLTKAAPNIPGQERQPSVLQVCKESRAIGKKHHTLVQERGGDCTGDCPRCRYLTSDYGTEWGSTNESIHTFLAHEDRNAHWVNFDRDVFLLSYGTDDGNVASLGYRTVWPIDSDFCFEDSDLARIQHLYFKVVPGPLIYKSLDWCLKPGTMLKNLKEIRFEFYEGGTATFGKARGTFKHALWKKTEAEKYFKLIRDNVSGRGWSIDEKGLGKVLEVALSSNWSDV